MEAFTLYLIQQGLSTITVRHYVAYMAAFLREYKLFTEENARICLLYKLTKNSPATHNKNSKAMRHYCKFVGIPPFPFLKCLQEKPKSRVILTDDQIEHMIQGDDKYSLGYAIHAYTGCRTSDVLQLKVSDIDLNMGCMYFQHGKGGRNRTAPIVPPLHKRLIEYLSHYSGNFVLEHNGKRVSDSIYTRNWRKKLITCGITSIATPHSLRHSFLTNTLGNGANLFAIQDIVGHTSAETTRKYYHGNLALMKKAAQKLPIAQKNENPQDLIEGFIEIMDEYLGKDQRLNKEELLEAKKHLYRSIKKAIP